MLKKLVTVLITIPLAIILIVFSVANRGSVSLTLDPFNPGNPLLTMGVPLFVIILTSMMIGVLIGGTATWLKQGKHRKRARTEKSRAEDIKVEAEALKAERKAALAEAGLGSSSSNMPLLARPS